MLTMATLHTSALFTPNSGTNISAKFKLLKASSQCSKVIYDLAEAALLLTYIGEIIGSNFSRDTDRDDRGFSYTSLASSGERLTASQTGYDHFILHPSQLIIYQIIQSLMPRNLKYVLK
jgi:hypothetical protein